MEEKILSMYAKGMTTGDIESHMRELSNPVYLLQVSRSGTTTDLYDECDRGIQSSVTESDEKQESAELYWRKDFRQKLYGIRYMLYLPYSMDC